MKKNYFREAKIENFAGTWQDLTTVLEMLQNAMAHLVLDRPAWDVLYEASRQIRAELKKVL